MSVAARLRVFARAAPCSALLRDAVLAGIGAAASRVFLLALGVLVSRQVGEPALFGVFSSILLAVQLVAMFAGLGLAQTAAQAIAAAADDRERQDRTVRSIVALVVACGMLAGTGLWLVGRDPGWLLPVPQAARALAGVASLLLAAQLVVGGLEGILRGLRLFRVLGVAGCVASAIGLACAVPLVRALGVRGGVLAAAGFLVLQALLYAWPLAARLRGRLLPPRALGRLLGITLAPTFLNGVAWNLAMLLPPLLLAREQGGLEQLALWNAASQIRTIVSFVPIVVANAAIPRLAAAYAQRGGWRHEVVGTLVLAMGSAFLGFLPVAVAAGPLMGIYGAIYAQHGALLWLVASFVLLQVLGSALFVILLAARGVWQSALLNVAWSTTILLLAPRWIASDGALGLATLYLWSYAPVLALLAMLVLRTMRRSPPDVAVSAANVGISARRWSPGSRARPPAPA